MTDPAELQDRRVGEVARLAARMMGRGVDFRPVPGLPLPVMHSGVEPCESCGTPVFLASRVDGGPEDDVPRWWHLTGGTEPLGGMAPAAHVLGVQSHAPALCRIRRSAAQKTC